MLIIVIILSSSYSRHCVIKHTGPSPFLEMSLKCLKFNIIYIIIGITMLLYTWLFKSGIHREEGMYNVISSKHYITRFWGSMLKHTVFYFTMWNTPY